MKRIKLYEDFLNKNTLLAPNGKQTNLNSIQYHLVRTPEFKNWFGDWENDPTNSSKMVDSNGEPKVVYHGSAQRNLTSFDAEKAGTVQYADWGKGVYFTPSESGADYYSKEAIKKNDKEYNDLYNNFLETNSSEDLKKFQERGKILSSNKDTIIYRVFLNIRKPLREPTSGMNDPYLAETAKGKNKDGIFIMNNMSLTSYDEIVSFYSNQIKLATGENTTFSINSNNIKE